MPAHDFQDETALVGVGGRGNGINSLNDPVESWISADSHVRATEVIVNGAHHAHDVQVGVLGFLLLSDLT